jgi:hypothetical protein
VPTWLVDPSRQHQARPNEGSDSDAGTAGPRTSASGERHIRGIARRGWASVWSEPTGLILVVHAERASRHSNPIEADSATGWLGRRYHTTSSAARDAAHDVAGSRARSGFD